MARKDIFSSVMNAAPRRTERIDAVNYIVSGASRSIKSSFEELAKASVVELDPDLVDGSFIADRIEEDDEAFQELLTAVRERGQDSPVLVRPHPSAAGRYQVVFGHRRVRVAKQLGRQVRAVVRALDDQDHVIAQGQENAARANLSFIERALFAKRLGDFGYDQSVVKSALALDATTFSKMQSVAHHIPEDIILAIGSARATGRDRWWQLSKLLEMPDNQEKARALVASGDFANQTGDARIARLLDFLGRAKRTSKTVALRTKAWAPEDKSLRVDITDSGKAFTLALKAKNASRFGAYIEGRLEELYRAFQETESANKNAG